MGNVFSRIKDKSIFKDERFLYPEFVPERLPFRDPQIDQLARALRPAADGKKPFNVFVFGPPGSGKTACIKFVLGELQQFSDRTKSLYLNCWQINSRSAILNEIVNFLGFVSPRRGISVDELHNKFVEALRASKFIPIIVLDEVDQLLESEDGLKVLYDLLRVGELQKNFLGLVLISNRIDFLAQLDLRVKSSLMADQTSFPAYSPIELKEILKQRTSFAFFPNVLEPDAINVAAAHAAKSGGDARVGIEVLLKAGRLAEAKNSAKVSLLEVKEAFAIAKEYELKDNLNGLNEGEKELLKILSKSTELSSVVLLSTFQKSKAPSRSPRSYRSFISNLERLHLIESTFINQTNPKGRARIIQLKTPVEFLKDLK